ncbi:iron complex outermembrane receptor protein [Lacibacter cauensis]|uniref:Iron complex outermembrane receptor protein n=1 Tax=Lacibacter cauensis TaxID=510947 RepID=A0A562SQP9_9BACT|nr:SusC/RagA family TonB-linked outer membrane protein [Lacibacter cauensis]TWI83126.1 iron complex outermembrane receptor protein [Lacibacter cauensis]
MILTKLARGILTMLSLFVFVAFATAQTKTVTGKVTDSKGEGVPSATVAVKGTKVSTTTGPDGSFSLSAPTSAKTLVISSVGFGTKEVSITDGPMAVTLETQNAALNEVVVIGYGTRKVKDLTGSVSNITTKDFNKGQIATPDQLLQGRTPGVLVTPASGEPGSAATINIRGTASIRGNQEPLYVVDGVPIASGGTLGSASGVEGSSTPRNPLMFLNPNDIESITVLKDASAAAIYGSRGANGVVLITTKSGKGGKKGQITFSAATSIATTAKRYDLMNAQDFLLAAKKANIDGGADPVTAAAAVELLDKKANTDWQDQIFRTGVSQNYNLGWGFNAKSTNVRLSGSYDDQQGIIRNSSLKRLTARANITQKFWGDKLKFELASTFSSTKNQYPPLSNNAGYQGSLLGAALQFNPTYPVYNPDGSFYQPGDQRNPAQMLAYFDDNDRVNRFLNSISGSWNITKGLTYKVVLGLDNMKSERIAFADPRLSTNAYSGTTTLSTPNGITVQNYNNSIQGNGRTTKQNLDLKSTLVEHYLTYDKDFGKSNFNIVGGFSYQNFITEYSQRVGWGLNTPVVGPKDVFVKDFNNFKNYADLYPGYDKNELQSFFGRVNYSFDDRYFLTATVRADGSSKFGANNRYGVFPAFAAKWKLINEEFARNSFGRWFSDFSVRANYGVLGSQDGLPSYGAVNRQFNYKDANGANQNTLVQTGNPDLKWEQAATTGAGVDLTTKDNRLNITVDYFYTKRTNILFNAPTPGGFAPTSNWFINLPGYVINKGWEVSLGYKIIKGKKFTWDANYNMTFVKNELRDMPVPVITGGVSGQGLTGAYAQTFTNGQPLFTWSMPVFRGFDGNGNARYENGAQNQLVGTAIPNFFAGLTNNFTLGNWSLSVFANTVRGFHVYNNTANALFLKGSLRNGRNVTYAAGTSPENPFNPGSVSTRFLEKGDFIRISNVNLSYAFNLKNSKVVKSLSVYASGQNLALFTKYTGIDPEVNVDKNINGVPSRGFDYTNYPRPRVVTFGLNLGF